MPRRFQNEALPRVRLHCVEIGRVRADRSAQQTDHSRCCSRAKRLHLPPARFKPHIRMAYTGFRWHIRSRTRHYTDGLELGGRVWRRNNNKLERNDFEEALRVHRGWHGTQPVRGLQPWRGRPLCSAV
jgi:hypothetical protein